MLILNFNKLNFNKLNFNKLNFNKLNFNKLNFKFSGKIVDKNNGVQIIREKFRIVKPLKININTFQFRGNKSNKIIINNTRLFTYNV